MVSESGRPGGPFDGNSLWMAEAAWGVTLAAGVFTVILGIMIVAWPDATIAVVGVLVGLQLLIYGILRIAQAIVAHEGGAVRAVYALIGALSILAGVLALRHLVQAVTVLTLLFGLFWLIGGILEFVNAVTDPERPHKGVAITMSLLTIIAGIVVLAYPGMTLLALTIITGSWLIVWGVVMTGFTLWLRYGSRSSHRRTFATP